MRSDVLQFLRTRGVEQGPVNHGSYVTCDSQGDISICKEDMHESFGLLYTLLIWDSQHKVTPLKDSDILPLP
jgi:hypothetical protein